MLKPPTLRLFSHFHTYDSPLWNRINNAETVGGMGLAKRNELMIDLERATDAQLDALNANNGELISFWEEIAFLKSQRMEADFLRSYNRFKYLKNNEFKHIWELHGQKGGHRYLYVTDNLNGPELYKIVPDNPMINSTIPVIERTKIYPINGHVYYENVWRYNPNAPTYTLNGLKVSKKSKHFIINPAWNEQKLIEEMSFAFTNKRVKTPRRPMEINFGGNKLSIFETRYKSEFTDGTQIEITYRTQDADAISGNLTPDHISLFSINKPIN